MCRRVSGEELESGKASHLYCDGRQPMCPEDAFWENGTPCPGGYCYNGACPTVAQRCRDLWGPGEAGMGPGHGPLRTARVAAGPESEG